MKRRKHRLVLEVTISKPLTDDDAVRGLRLVLSRLDLDASPIWSTDNSPYVDKIEVKSYGRVVSARARVGHRL